MGIYENVLKLKNDIPEEVTLIAVSKTRSLDEMEEAYKAGVRDFGENKVQEFKDKVREFHQEIRWHFIGHLQSNKVKYLVDKVYLIHSMDRVSLLHEIEKQYKLKGKICNVLIEINIGREESKTGLLIEDLEELLLEVERCEKVKVMGLMTVIPKGDEESCRGYFREIKNIFDSLKVRKFNNISMDILSMGMTNDYKIALEEGSNIIRIGEGIFGKRTYKKQI
ncbi:YggS family pyridoxal phosphate-dependent enzyme [Clostridium frigidicarnis]|uniref:Pyridoxal phosphate homeostasis protein n=1 Tax=Clostridium frigidicarnis TaxID=84698 RepID=A0A1I0WJ49_9CLOT|nr:YggS family pyridoxal phosphate-dependent enzyme [Clostridium frigidicarnis]SFA88258.1 hypothetical protein SAMN04488528_1005109 [Clostridium frigidicarnis]